MVLHNYIHSNSRDVEKEKTVRRNIRKLMKFIKQETQEGVHNVEKKNRVKIDRCYESISEDEDPYPLPSTEVNNFFPLTKSNRKARIQ